MLYIYGSSIHVRMDVIQLHQPRRHSTFATKQSKRSRAKFLYFHHRPSLCHLLIKFCPPLNRAAPSPRRRRNLARLLARSGSRRYTHTHTYRPPLPSYANITGFSVVSLLFFFLSLTELARSCCCSDGFARARARGHLTSIEIRSIDRTRTRYREREGDARAFPGSKCAVVGSGVDFFFGYVEGGGNDGRLGFLWRWNR